MRHREQSELRDFLECFKQIEWVDSKLGYYWVHQKMSLKELV